MGAAEPEPQSAIQSRRTSALLILGLFSIETIPEQNFAWTCSRSSAETPAAAGTSLQEADAAKLPPVHCLPRLAWTLSRHSKGNAAHLTGGTREQNTDTIATIWGR